MNPKASILLVEDDPGLGFVIKDNLQLRGFDIQWCLDGEEAEKSFSALPADVCILDVMLPKKDGFALARSIREKSPDVPILFLTAKSMTEDKLEGFRSGGDDYITKPFSMEELVMRIEVFLRRSNGMPGVEAEPDFYLIGQYRFEPRNLKLVHPEGEKILTEKESEVLKLLYLHRDRVLKREEILTKIWGDDDYFMGRSMDVFISKLRKYLKDDPAVEIVNYHGVGFRLEVGQ